MKKFTKGCLLTALVIFVTGCVICGVSGLLGGFKQLENISETSGIPFRYYRGADGSVQFGFFDPYGNDWDMDMEDIQERIEIHGTQSEKQLELTSATLRNLEVDLGACALSVQESGDDHVWMAVEGDTQEIHYAIENGDTLVIESSYDPVFGWFGWKKNVESTVVYLSLPKGAVLDEIDLEFGAGKIDMGALKANNIDIEFGAGVCNVEALEANTVSLSVGAGEAIVSTLTAKEADLDVGAGELVIEDIRTDGNADLDIGVGSAEINGTITGDLDADCGMGNLMMQLTGSEEDHSYNVDCAMGSVTIGSRTYTALSDNAEWGSQNRSTFDIDCAMGNVTIVFDESSAR
ncbi:MAG: DUF4097 family beta strand repeat protein [Lachnospiraceae bacterium]|nr:DUF4097 family beta strand repeat protein [Lachnospiraceae bacterium]